MANTFTVGDRVLTRMDREVDQSPAEVIRAGSEGKVVAVVANVCSVEFPSGVTGTYHFVNIMQKFTVGETVTTIVKAMDVNRNVVIPAGSRGRVTAVPNLSADDLYMVEFVHLKASGTFDWSELELYVGPATDAPEPPGKKEKPPGKTSASHPAEIKAGMLVTCCGNYYRLTHQHEGRWWGANLGSGETHTTVLGQVPLPFLFTG